MHATIRQLALSAYVLLLLSAGVAAQTWTDSGQTHTWNSSINWNPFVISNSTTANVIFPELSQSGLVNISSSVQTKTIRFGNIAHTYTLTSSANQILSGPTDITVGSGVTATDTINMANVATGTYSPCGGNSRVGSLGRQ